MSKECPACGREEDGHWIGCEKAPIVMDRQSITSGGVDGGIPPVVDQCAYGDCKEPRRSDDKRVKFCETHSDPKNRK